MKNLCLVLGLMWLAAPVSAEELVATEKSYGFLGYGRLVNNDLWGDGQDRWRTGSVSASRVYGKNWAGQAPQKPFELIELRTFGQVIAPADLTSNGANDRQFAGHFEIGIHTHFETKGIEFAIGADLALIGPQTGLEAFQSDLHNALGVDPSSDAIRNSQIGDDLRVSGVIELGKSFDIGENMSLYAFTELRGGVENLARVGLDFQFGKMFKDTLFARDQVTGQRYAILRSANNGVGFVLGADVAHVSESAFFPQGSAVEMSQTRHRARAGIAWQRDKSDGFFGLTYLSPEFESQPEGQVVGSLRIRYKF